ncbi:HsdM family class I SAM-dependent methyltransferase [Pseudomonas guariconensis]|uniref:HsdM family class I SAM-dependent methyltransferase n=1 Tax=Pseudomonas guariconensis TaxID=1288410 RepID=UPI002FE582BE
MKFVPSIDPADTQALRKERGAFFTPSEITHFISEWAIRTPDDKVLEPSAGDAAFLVAAVRRLQQLSSKADSHPTVSGVEIHGYSAQVAAQRVASIGGTAEILHSDFFVVAPKPVYDTVIGNPPYIRYQDFSGEARARSREAALRAGVALTGLASSWAAFTIHSAMFLKPGGRLGLVLPAELLSVNYAAPVRQFLFTNFSDVQLVLFEQQVFPEAEADVVLLLADGFKLGAAKHATIHQARNSQDLSTLGHGLIWTPTDPAAKWTSGLIDPKATQQLNKLFESSVFTTLETWGDTTLGIVTGNNKYFTLSPKRASELGLTGKELLRLSPPGSAHLRGLSLTKAKLDQLGEEGQAIYLFYPKDKPSAEAKAYIEDGHRTGVDTAYKCRVRKIWHKVPLVPAADLFLTCMNADTARLCANEAGARYLNSVHGVFLHPEHRVLGIELLPLASLNSVTLLHAEIVGRAYGGGILKIEPKEADNWAMPSPGQIIKYTDELRRIKPIAAKLLESGRLLDAVELVDGVLFSHCPELTKEELSSIKQAREVLAQRRTVRGASGR